MKRPSIAAMVLVLACAPSTMAQRQLRASDVLRVIERDGSPAALKRIFDDTSQSSILLRGVARGTGGWLAVAAKLRPVSDAGASEELDLAVAEALPRSPAGVLRLLPAPFAVARICGVPFVEQPVAESQSYRRRALAAVVSVRDHRLRSVRDQCLDALRSAKPITVGQLPNVSLKLTSAWRSGARGVRQDRDLASGWEPVGLAA